MTFTINYFVYKGKFHGHVEKRNTTFTGNNRDEIKKASIEYYKKMLKCVSSKYSDP